MRLALIALLAAALPAMAQMPMSAEEFDTYSRDKTLYYAIDGTIYGAEHYLSGRRVVWAFKGQECRSGIWYEEAGQICFVYEHGPEPQCWRFFKSESGIRALFEGDLPGSELTEVAQSSEPLVCAGPDVGV